MTLNLFQQFGTVYAAVVATVALLWNIVRDRRATSQDARNLKVSSSISCVSPVQDGKQTTTSYALDLENMFKTLPDGERSFQIMCTNTGRRPLTLSAWVLISVTIPNQHDRASTSFSPQPTLLESQSTSFTISDFNKLRGNVLSLAVEDTHGKTWYLPQSEFQRMKELMLEYRL